MILINPSKHNGVGIHLKPYIISTITGISISVIVCWLKNLSFSLPKPTIYRILSDATFVSAVLLVGTGVMVSISNAGLFFGVSYAIKRFKYRLSSTKSIEKTDKTADDFPSYQDYLSTRKTAHLSGAFIYIPGLLFLVLSVIFIMLYY